jgi:type IV pilus assembly protein PilE
MDNIIRRRATFGFTLIELLIVTAVIAILAALAVPSYSNYVMRSKQVRAKSGLVAVVQAQEIYRFSNGAYADTISSLVGLGGPASLGEYRFSILEADEESFVARATGDINGDRVDDDAWTITQDGMLTHTLDAS